MKNSSKSFFFFLILSTFFFVKCSADKKQDSNESTTSEEAHHEHEATAETGTPQFTVDQTFKKQLADLFAAYIALKESFVSSDASKVSAEAKKTSEALTKVDMMLVSDKAHTDWMTYQNELSKSLTQIGKAADIEQKREHFSDLSNSMYKVIKAYGLAGVTAYYDFCPMAFNDRGAYWLSDDKKIRNPYFGDQMLGCGSVEETLQ